MEGYCYIICVDLCMGQALGLSCGPRAVNLPPPAMPASEPRGGQVHPLATAPPQGPQGVHVARQAWAKIKTDTITGSSPEDNRKRFLLFSFVGAQILICQISYMLSYGRFPVGQHTDRPTVRGRTA